MKIALAQINSVVGDIDGNAKRIISVLAKAKADIVVFPELSITGYSPQDLLLRKNFIGKNIDALRHIVRHVKNKTVIVGFVEKAYGSIYNSAAIIKDQQILEIHRKICLPNYTIFDEKRWFKEGTHATTFQFKGMTIGVNICEDIWLPETVKRQKDRGAGFIVNISASPYMQGKIEAVESVLKQRWKENKLPMIYVNQIGGQDGIVYYGHSMYFNNGKIVKKAKDFEEEILTVEL